MTLPGQQGDNPSKTRQPPQKQPTANLENLSDFKMAEDFAEDLIIKASQDNHT